MKPIPKRYAAIDLGTNSCRMVVVQYILGRGAPFKILDAASVPVYLGEKLATSGKLSEESMQRSIRALEGFVRKFEKWKPSLIIAVATESFRRAENSQELVDEIRQKLNIDFDIISPKKEMQFALLACRNLFKPDKPFGLLFDIGGGSLQIAWLNMNQNKKPQIINILSLPSGLAILKEKFGIGTIDDEKLEEIRQSIADDLKEFNQKNAISQHLENNQVSCVGASGVLTSLTCLQYGYEKYNRKQIDGEQLNIESACHVANHIRKLEREQRATYGCVGADRADMLAVGCAMVICLFEQFPLANIVIADRGLREGIIAEIIDQEESKLQTSNPQTSSPQTSDSPDSQNSHE